MQSAFSRWIVFYDLAMTPYPSDAAPIPLRDFVDGLQERVASEEAFKLIDSDRRAIRILEMKRDKLPNDQEVMCLLVSLCDLDSADPAFQNFKTGKLRIPPKEEGEGGAVSVHVVLKLDPVNSDSHIYQMVFEDVIGLGKSKIQEILRHQFKVLSKDLGLFYERESGSQVQTRPMVEMAGHQSEYLKNALKDGQPLGIELWNPRVESKGFDESPEIKNMRRELRISVVKDFNPLDFQNVVAKWKEWGKQNDYTNMRVRWRSPSASKPEAATFPTAKQDVGEALFTRQVEVEVVSSLPQACDTMRGDLLSEMKKVMVE